MAAAHVFVDDLRSPGLGDDDRHHLDRVLRLRPGEEVSASDGAGGVVRCVYRVGGMLEPAGDIRHVPRPAPAITVGFAIVKGERPEWIVQKLTECGADVIVPFTAARSVVRWDAAKSERQVERWRRVAREAAMQSRRAWLPLVHDVSTFAEAVSIDPQHTALADPSGDAPSLERPTLLIGPEGGWADDERARWPTVRLGPHVMRAETASVAAAVLLGALRIGAVSSHFPGL